MVSLSQRLVPQDSSHSEDSFLIQEAPLSLEVVHGGANAPANGAIVIMSGTVRNQTQGRSVTALEYQVYEPMAIAVFQEIGAEIRHQWMEVNRVVMHHRWGHLRVGDISVLVAVGTPHRATAFAACQYAIDSLKARAPIWKKEWYGDRDYRWVQGC